jgi:hypothetical protein
LIVVTTQWYADRSLAAPQFTGIIKPANGTNSITITPPTGNLFFRLSNP